MSGLVCSGCRVMRLGHRNVEAMRPMAIGEPDAGKPPVRFDEGRSATVIGSGLSTRPLRLLY